MINAQRRDMISGIYAADAAEENHTGTKDFGRIKRLVRLGDDYD